MPSEVISHAYSSLGLLVYLLFIPDGTRILHGLEDGTIQVWDFSFSLQELIKIQTEDPSQVGDWAHFLDNQIIVSGTLKGSYHFWDVTFPMLVRFCTASQGSKLTHLTSAPNDLTTQRWEQILCDASQWQGDPCVHNHNWVESISKETIFVDVKSNTCIATLNVSHKP